jgi:hypothetical protein
MRPRAVLVGVGVSIAAGAAASGVAGMPRDAVPASAPTLLRLDGIGPLHIGMTRAAGIKAGWLAKPQMGCELSGRPYPVVYQLTGAKAPSGLKGTAEFYRGHLLVLAFSDGVRTSTRVTVKHTSVAQMVHRYRDAGYVAQSHYIDTFGGRFVNVSRRGGGDTIISAFSEGKSTDHAISTLAVPDVPVCE